MQVCRLRYVALELSLMMSGFCCLSARVSFDTTQPRSDTLPHSLCSTPNSD
ncbi:Uncharacterized protein DAT39_020369, partial [Clarias magur]